MVVSIRAIKQPWFIHSCLRTRHSSFESEFSHQTQFPWNQEARKQAPFLVFAHLLFPRKFSAADQQNTTPPLSPCTTTPAISPASWYTWSSLLVLSVYQKRCACIRFWLGQHKLFLPSPFWAKFSRNVDSSFEAASFFLLFSFTSPTVISQLLSL